MPEITLGELAGQIGATLENGDPGQTVHRLASLSEAGPGDLSFLANPAYADQLASTKAGAVIVGRAVPAASVALLRVDNPDFGFARAAEIIVPPPPRPEAGVHPTAVVSPQAKLGADVSVGARVVVEAGAVIGDRTVLYPGTYIGYESQIGADCTIFPNVTVYHKVTLGARCIIHAGAVIGSDGFGFAWTGKEFFKVPQVGVVVIGDDVELGANTCIDRARFGETRIGNGSKFDNLIQIAHNVKIGNHSAFAAMVAIAGSATIGNHVQMAGQSTMVGHLTLGDGVTVLGQSAVSKNIPGVDSGASKEDLLWVGTPAKPMREQLKEWQNLKAMGRLRKTVKELESRLERLEKEKHDS